MKNLPFNVVTIILVTLIGLVPYAPGVIDTYGLSSLSRELIICMLAVSVAKNITYDNIVSKCLCIGFAITQILQAIVFCTYYFSYYSLSGNIMFSLFALIMLSSIFMARQLFMRAKFTSDEIDDTFIYYLCPKADDLNGLLSSLFYFPFSGVKVYANGKVYSYKRGVMTELTGRHVGFYLKRCHAFNTNVMYTSEIQSELDALVGTKWTFRDNCYSTFEPMFGSLASLLKGK